jgi:hypothetical protein
MHGWGFTPAENKIAQDAEPWKKLAMIAESP